MSQIPKPSGLPRPNFVSKTNTNILPSKNLLNQPSTSKTTTKVAPKPRNIVDKPKPLKPLNRNMPTNTISRAPKRVGPPLNEVKAKVVKRTPIKVASSKPIRKSVGRRSTVAVTKKPAPYDYKARFALLQEKHTKLVAELKERKLEYANSEVIVQDLKEKISVLNDNWNSTEKKLKEAEILIESLNKSCSELKIEKQSLENKFERLEVLLKEANDKNNELSLINEDLKDKNNKLCLDLNEVKSVNFNLNTEVENLSKELKEKNETIESYCEKLQQFDLERKKLNNDIQELKGNIRVFCRVRPPLKEEYARNAFSINYLDEKSLEVSKKPKTSLTFSFDQVFSSDTKQEVIFQELSQLIQSVLDGYNVCVFAYGQTGSGKTYTMDGGSTQESKGMIPRAIELIFQSIKSAETLNWTYNLQVSFLEIYKEKIQDLLKERQNVDIKNIEQTSIPITNASDLFQAMFKAQKYRTTAATESNERSSRSHSLVTITVEGYNSSRKEKVKSYLNLVDLAGSEKIQTIGTDRIDETKNINKSLSTLTHVILCLKENREHVPYRDSKLTFLLKPSLGGNSKTLMIVNIAPFEDCFEESIYSLRFATNVNQCRVGTIKKNKSRLPDATPVK